MSLPEQIEQHTELGILTLTPDKWGKPRIAALLAAFLDRVQALEDDLFQIMVDRELPEADLVRLKVLGKLIGQPRFGLAEEDYRTVLEARGLANVSKGTARDVFGVLDVLLGAGQYVLIELGNATLSLSVLGTVDANQIKMLRLVLPDVRAAGVGFQLVFSDDADVFIWGDTWSDTEEWGSVILI